MICELCQHSFNEATARRSCARCNSANTCQGVRCPACGYEMVPEPRWIGKLFSFFNRSSHQLEEPTRTQSLTTFPLHVAAKVEHLDYANHAQLRKLLAMGVMPECEITLLQRFPSYVFQIGFAKFTIDAALASAVYVTHPSPVLA